jgi:hypothetical protein
MRALDLKVQALTHDGVTIGWRVSGGRQDHLVRRGPKGGVGGCDCMDFIVGRHESRDCKHRLAVRLVERQKLVVERARQLLEKEMAQ